MTQINRDELIKKIAKAIHKKRNGVFSENLLRNDPRIIEAYQQDAEAALKAIGDYLPPVKHGYPHKYDSWEAMEAGLHNEQVLSQFKNICEGK